MPLLILFGLPGAGKTYVGKIVEKHFSYHFHDGDDDLPLDMRQAIQHREPIREEQRNKFFTNIQKKISDLSQSHTHIVLAQTYIKDIYRRNILESFPYAQFILIHTDTEVRESRLAKRTDYPLDGEYSRKMIPLFEPPTVPHEVLTNTHNGTKEVIQQLEIFLKKRT